MELLVMAQTNSIEQIEGLCKYIRNLESDQAACKTEEELLAKKRKAAEKRIDSIKRFLVPYFIKKGKTTAGAFTISTRKSNRVIVDDKVFKDRFLMTHKPEEWNPDKKAIKNAFKEGKDVPGCIIQLFHSLQVK